MGRTGHRHRALGKLKIPLLALALLPGVVTSLAAQREAFRPSKNACPVVADLFPKQEKSNDLVIYRFPENLVIPINEAGDPSRVAQRFSISLLTSGSEDVEITFYWESAGFFGKTRIDWGENSGRILVKGDGNPNCFFLGPSTGLPVNIPCASFSLRIPPGVELKEVMFSSRDGEELVSGDCPMPELERQIGEAFWESLKAPLDEMKTRRFLSLLEKAIPEYRCFSRFDGHPVPAIFMADLASIWNWLDHLYLNMDKENDYALKVFAGIYDKDPDGVLAEVMADHVEKLLRDRPLFILRNWPEIRSHKRNILASRGLWDLDDDILLINIYGGIAAKEPKYRSACEEIISILSEKEPSERCGRP